MKTVVFDFDGVIHSYTSGWQGATVIADAPVEGIREAVAEIRAAGYEVAVVSTRCATPDGLRSVKQWLAENDIEVDKVCAEKPPAVVYIDDRAICFDGDSVSLLDKIESFQPWYKKTDTAVDDGQADRIWNSLRGCYEYLEQKTVIEMSDATFVFKDYGEMKTFGYKFEHNGKLYGDCVQSTDGLMMGVLGCVLKMFDEQKKKIVQKIEEGKHDEVREFNK